ncbi:MAG: hypothetical protein LBI84_01250, partial [Propionibacteriaceae bacterium]|nr:hypothetical protein [Propionibacteriaceae bacterium]
MNFTLSVPNAPSLRSEVVWRGLISAIRVKGVIAICLVSTFVYIHFESTAPLFFGKIGQTTFLSLMFVINATTVVATQFIATQLIERLSTRLGLIVGFAFYGAGFICFSLPADVIAFWVLGVALFSFGEVIVSLLIDYEIAIAVPERSANVFGISNLANALGGLAGGWAGAIILG